MGEEEDTPWDVKTTPKWLRVPTLIVFGLVIVYLLSCFHFTLRSEGVPRWVWFGYWQMFSYRDRGNSDVEAKGLFDGEWEPIDMPALFPTRWESGYRWSRSSFRRSRRRMSVLAASTCERHPDDPSRVVFTEIRWGKVLGSLERKNVRKKVLMDWPCDRSMKLPNGTRVGGRE